MSDLPRGWVEAPLAQLGTWCGGGTPSKGEPRYWLGGTIPWVSPKDMKSTVIRDSEDHITEPAVTASTMNLVDAGAVLVVTRSGILRHSLPVATTARPVTINQDLKALVPHTGVLPEYVAWGLRANAQRILRECSKGGTTVQSVETTQLLRFRLPLAPSAEQERIVAAIEEQFSRADAGLALLERVRRALTQMRSAVLGDVPDQINARQVPLSDLAVDVRTGLDRGRVQQRTSPPGHGYVRMGNVHAGAIWLDDLTYIDATDDEVTRYELRDGDILFNNRNSHELVGKAGLVQSPQPGTLYNNNLVRIRLAEAILPEYLALQMSAPQVSGQLDRMKSATTNVAAIYTRDLLGLKVAVPPLDVQEAAVARAQVWLTGIMSASRALATASQRGQSLKSSILLAAYSGKLVAQDPTDEPAESVLERIAAEREAANLRRHARPRELRGPRRKVTA